MGFSISLIFIKTSMSLSKKKVWYSINNIPLSAVILFNFIVSIIFKINFNNIGYVSIYHMHNPFNICF